MKKGNIILENLYKGFGHALLIINYVLFIPSLTIFAEVARCVNDAGLAGAKDFVCLD